MQKYVQVNVLGTCSNLGQDDNAFKSVEPIFLENGKIIYFVREQIKFLPS